MGSLDYTTQSPLPCVIQLTIHDQFLKYSAYCATSFQDEVEKRYHWERYRKGEIRFLP